MTRLVLVAALALTGCATAGRPERPPEVRTVTVTVPGSLRSCVPAGLASPPQYVDSDAALKAAPGAEDRFQLLAAGRVQRSQRLAEVEPVIAGCR